MGYKSNIFLLMPKTIWDVDALAFITAHETNTGVSMGSIQKNAINNFYKRLKGIGTPNGSNLHAMAVTNGARIFPLCPIDNSTANALAYELDMVSNGVQKGVYHNFVSGDFTPQGVIGGTGKWFDTLINATTYSLSDVSYGYYSRTNLSNATVDFGNSSRTTLYGKNGVNAIVRINDTTTSSVANANSLGLQLISRNGTTKYFTKNATKYSVATGVAVVSSSIKIFFHANNNGSNVSANESSRQLSMYINGLDDLTANETTDLYDVIQNYQTEVITGGRQV